MKNKKIYVKPDIKSHTIETETILAASAAGADIIDSSAPDDAAGLSKQNFFFDNSEDVTDNNDVFSEEY